MKKLLVSGFCVVVAINLWFVDIYSFTLTKIEGGNQMMSAYQGKKILIITLPIQQTASADSLLHSLDSLAIVHSSMLKIIAVPAIEDGYTEALKSELHQWYRDKLGSGIIITEGLYTRKTSGTQQHPLFSWLTHEVQNEHFDIDAMGPGSKFFAKSNGELAGVLKPQTRIGSNAMIRLLQLQ